MVVTSYSQARANLASLMDRVAQDADEVRITRRGKPDVVLIAAAELEGLRETAYLLRSPANAERLLGALERARQGTGVAISEDDLAAIRRDVEALDDRPGGTSPTLERLVRASGGEGLVGG